MKSHWRDRQFPRDVVEKMRARRQEAVAKLRAMSEREGKLLFEGNWMTTDEVRRTFRAMRRRSWLVFFEVLALFVVMLLGIFAISILLIWLVV